MKKSEENMGEATLHTDVNWQDMYHVTEEWKSDLIFFKDELHFFNDLLSKYFIQLIEDLEMTKSLNNELDELESRRAELYRKVEVHMGSLSEHFSGPFTMLDPIYIDEHHQLKVDFLTFNNQFRKTKKALYKHIDSILKSEKSKHLINKL